MSILSKIYVTLPKVTITLLGGRRVLVSVLFFPPSVLPVPPGRQPLTSGTDSLQNIPRVTKDCQGGLSCLPAWTRVSAGVSP